MDEYSIDTASQTMKVTAVFIGRRTAIMDATDEDGKRWEIRMAVPVPFGGKFGFAYAVKDRVDKDGKFLLYSHYDTKTDEWYSEAGDHRILSKHLHFREVL